MSRSEEHAEDSAMWGVPLSLQDLNQYDAFFEQPEQEAPISVPRSTLSIPRTPLSMSPAEAVEQEPEGGVALGHASHELSEQAWIFFVLAQEESHLYSRARICAWIEALPDLPSGFAYRHSDTEGRLALGQRDDDDATSSVDYYDDDTDLHSSQMSDAGAGGVRLTETTAALDPLPWPSSDEELFWESESSSVSDCG